MTKVFHNIATRRRALEGRIYYLILTGGAPQAINKLQCRLKRLAPLAEMKFRLRQPKTDVNASIEKIGIHYWVLDESNNLIDVSKTAQEAFDYCADHGLNPVDVLIT